MIRSPIRTRSTGRGLFAVLLPTLECNLQCSYCFEDHPYGRWTLEQARHVLRQIDALARHLGVDEVRLHWQGGEPLLMGPGWWREVLPQARSILGDCGAVLHQHLQTNLTLYCPDLSPLVHEYLQGRLGTSFEVGRGRRCPGDEGESFRAAWATAHRSARTDGIDVGVLSLVGPEAIAEGASRVLSMLHDDHHVRGVRFVLPFATPQGRGMWVDPVEAGLFLAEAYRWWIDRGGDDHLRVKPFSFLRAVVAGRSPGESGLCFFSPCCADEGLAVTPAGDVVLCDNSVTASPGEAYGNLFGDCLVDIWHSGGRARVREQVRSLICDECAACRWLPVCRSGCLVRSRADLAPGRPRFHYCETYAMLFGEMERSLAAAR